MHQDLVYFPGSCQGQTIPPAHFTRVFAFTILNMHVPVELITSLACSVTILTIPCLRLSPRSSSTTSSKGRVARNRNTINTSSNRLCTENNRVGDRRDQTNTYCCQFYWMCPAPTISPMNLIWVSKAQSCLKGTLSKFTSSRMSCMVWNILMRLC